MKKHKYFPIILIQCSRYPLATSPVTIIWPIGRLKLVSGEIFDYKLQPKINMMRYFRDLIGKIDQLTDSV